MNMNNMTGATSATSPSTMVLVVDDDSFSLDLLTEMLMALGISEIHTSGTGRVALRTLAALPRTPDFVICDVFMPDMDGIEFLAELAKKGFPGGIILVSGEDVSMMDIAQQVALAEGLRMLGAFSKPIPQAVLAQALGRIAGTAATKTLLPF
jgi:CheY-like chemotaxis protein